MTDYLNKDSITIINGIRFSLTKSKQRALRLLFPLFINLLHKTCKIHYFTVKSPRLILILYFNWTMTTNLLFYGLSQFALHSLAELLYTARIRESVFLVSFYSYLYSYCVTFNPFLLSIPIPPALLPPCYHG